MIKNWFWKKVLKFYYTKMVFRICLKFQFWKILFVEQKTFFENFRQSYFFEIIFLGTFSEMNLKKDFRNFLKNNIQTELFDPKQKQYSNQGIFLTFFTTFFSDSIFWKTYSKHFWNLFLNFFKKKNFRNFFGNFFPSGSETKFF